jgi:hypothetical protein
MSKKQTRQEEKLDELNELLSYYDYPTKGETLCSHKGLLMGWIARLASTDYIVAQELENRLEIARQKHKNT